jgi:hypothetical protein
MPAKSQEPANPPVPEAAHAGGAWRPHIDTEPEFNPFASTGAWGDGRTQFQDSATELPEIRDATEDTAPLEGSRDLSDADSLEDVVAAAARGTRIVKPA